MNFSHQVLSSMVSRSVLKGGFCLFGEGGGQENRVVEAFSVLLPGTPPSYLPLF